MATWSIFWVDGSESSAAPTRSCAAAATDSKRIVNTIRESGAKRRRFIEAEYTQLRRRDAITRMTMVMIRGLESGSYSSCSSVVRGWPETGQAPSLHEIVLRRDIVPQHGISTTLFCGLLCRAWSLVAQRYHGI